MDFLRQNFVHPFAQHSNHIISTVHIAHITLLVTFPISPRRVNTLIENFYCRCNGMNTVTYDEIKTSFCVWWFVFCWRTGLNWYLMYNSFHRATLFPYAHYTHFRPIQLNFMNVLIIMAQMWNECKMYVTLQYQLVLKSLHSTRRVLHVETPMDELKNHLENFIDLKIILCFWIS